MPRTVSNGIKDKVRRRRPVPSENRSERLAAQIHAYNLILSLLNESTTDARKIFEGELVELRGKLRHLIETDLTLREAMFLSSVGSSERAIRNYLNEDPAQRNNSIRKHERLFMNYLQRFCAKPITSGFYGPTNFGKFAEKEQANVQISIESAGEKQSTHSEVFVSHWACMELSSALSRDPEIFPFVKPLLSRSYILTADTLLYFGIEEIELSETQKRIVHMADGIRNFKDIQASLDGLPDEVFWTECGALIQQEIITSSIVLKPYSAEGLKELLDFIGSVPPSAASANWQNKLGQLERLRLTYKNTPFPERIAAYEQATRIFEEITGKDSKRGAGEHFADRSIFSQQDYGTISRFEIGNALYRDILSSLGNMADVSALTAVAQWEFDQSVAALILRKLSPEKMEVPLFEFINEFEELREEILATDEFLQKAEAIKEASALFEQTVAMGGSVDTDSLNAKLSKILRTQGFLVSKNVPLTATFALNIGSRSKEDLQEGRYSLYFSARYSLFLLIGMDMYALGCPWLDDFKHEIERVYAKISNPRTPLHFPFRLGRYTPLRLNGYKFLMNDYLSLQEEPQQMSLFDLSVAAENGRVSLRERSSGLSFILPVFVPGNSGLAKIWSTFSFPVFGTMGDTGNVPPIPSEKPFDETRWKKLIVKPMGIEATKENFKEIADLQSFDLFWHVFQLNAASRLPENLFAYPPDCIAFYVDLRNFFLVELLQYYLRNSPQVSLTRYAPEEDQLWLDLGGKKYVFELLMGIYSMFNPSE